MEAHRSPATPAPMVDTRTAGLVVTDWRVSVVICTKDRPEELRRAIASVRAADPIGRTAEIVVVEEAVHARALPDVRYVHLPPHGRGFGHTRNVGVGEATGEILAFLDDDCLAERGWLESLVRPFSEDAEILGVAGAVLVKEQGAIGSAENILGFPGGGLRYLHAAGGKVVPTRHLSTCNCAYRREAIRRAGGFPEGARLGGEDFLLAERVTALGSCVYTPHAVVYHRPRGRLGAILRWFDRRGQSEVALVRATVDRWAFLRFLVRSSWTVRVLALLAILLRWPDLAVWLSPVAVFYYAMLLWRFRFALAYPTHRRAWWLVPVVKVTMDLGTELGRWRAVLARLRR
jgi:GT2 family glycosyltransferase